MTAIQGKCLCGAVTVRADVATAHVEVCHCEMCRRWASGPYMCVGHDGALEIDGKDDVTVYQSSEWGRRAFCKNCGTALYWHMPMSGHYAISAGILLDQTSLTMSKQIFVDEKPAYYDFANDTPKMTGAEVMAAFNSSQGD